MYEPMVESAVMFVIGFLNNVIINSVIDVQKYKKIIKNYPDPIFTSYLLYWSVNYCFKFMRFICICDLYAISCLHVVKGSRMHSKLKL